MDDKVISVLVALLVVSIMLNIWRLFEFYKYRKEDNKISAPRLINGDGLLLLSLFIRAIKVEIYRNNSMDEWDNSFEGFTLYFNDKDPLNIVYLKHIGVNIYDAKTDEVKYSISIGEVDSFSIGRIINMISSAYFYKEGKDKNVWN